MTTRPKRILFVDHTAELGGGEIALLALLRELDRTLFEPVVLLLSEGPLTRELEGLAETHTLPLPGELLSTRRDDLSGSGLTWRKLTMLFVYLRTLSGLLGHLRPQIVHANSLKADLLAGLLARYHQIPQVWHIRDRITGEYLPKSAARIFRGICRILPNALIANSRSTLKSLGAQGDWRATVINSGLDLKPFVEASQAAETLPEVMAAGKEIRIGIVGRISPWKGQDIFLEAAARIQRQFPVTRFYIVGAPLFGETQFEARLKTLTAELGLEEKVTFTGFRRDIPELIQQMHIVLHASTIPEPFGQVIVQGMASCKPVVASEGGGPSEIIVNGSTGFLVPRKDPEALANATLYLLTHPEAAQIIARRGQQEALAKFGSARTTRAVEAIYRSLSPLDCA